MEVLTNWWIGKVLKPYLLLSLPKFKRIFFTLSKHTVKRTFGLNLFKKGSPMCHGSMIFLQEGKEATEVQEANLGV